MRLILLCLSLLLVACGTGGTGSTAVPTTPVTPAPITPAPTPPVAVTPMTACEQAFAELHRQPRALTTAGVVESAQTGARGAC